MNVTCNAGITVRKVSNCPLCENPGAIKYENVVDGAYETPGVWDYRECKNCGWIWVDPVPTEESIPKLYESYYTHSGEAPKRRWPKLRDQMLEHVWGTRYGYTRVRKRGYFHKWLSKLPLISEAAAAKVMYLESQDSGKLLDVGCGSGMFLNRMRNLGWHVEGIEPDPKAAELSEKRGIKIFADLNSCGTQRAGYYSAITMHHVIEHVPSPLTYIKKCYELLAPDGVMVIMTPNAYSLGALLFGKHWRSLEPPRHLHVFGEKALSYAMTISGFSGIKSWTPVRLARLTWPSSRQLKSGLTSVENKDIGLRLQMEAVLFWLLEGVVNFATPVGEELVCIGRKRGE